MAESTTTVRLTIETAGVTETYEAERDGNVVAALTQVTTAAWDPGENEPLRQRICAWLISNGIDPAAIPLHPEASLNGDRLTIDIKVRRMGKDGKLHDTIDPIHGDRIATTKATFTLTKPPPYDVAEWVRTTCGR